MRLASRPTRALLAAATLLGSGCGPLNRYYTLEPAPPASPPAPVAAAFVPVQLDVVHVPAEIDRPEVVTETAPGRLYVSGQDRWGAPLGEVMRRVLAQDLASRLPDGAFVFPDAPRPQAVRSLVVTVLQMTATADGRVEMDANWSLLDAGTPWAARGQNIHLTAVAPPGPDGQTHAVGAMLGQLADRIAASLLRT